MRKSSLTIAVALVLLTACTSTNNIPATTGSSSKSSVDTDFVVDGRYIDLSDAPLGSTDARPAGAVKFFIKGLVYSPVPIGTTVGDPPILDDALRDANRPIWSRDLPLMRAAGANAIHVYNVVPPPYDEKTGPISQFLDAAWNNNKKPVYVLMSIYFHGDKLLDNGAVQALAKQYHDLDQKYAKYPAVLGVTISNEIADANFLQNPTWWANFNIVAKAAKQGFVDGGDGDKIVTTSEPDGNIGAVKAGEKYNAAVDVWGINIYRGRTFTNLFDQIRQYTKKPVIFTEYGASAAYHPAWKNTYDWRNGKNQLGGCQPGERDGPKDRIVAELPKSGNPGMDGLVDLVWNNGRLLADGFNDSGVVSGGFYFEWTDEWWKGGNANVQQGNDAFNGGFPGCSEDQAWYGVNAVSKGNGTNDVLTPRPTLGQLTQSWSSAP
ncbi:MAG TPA: hypothetical protein VMU38_07465 [Candidatus Binatia bacterium]|nr:hypothetical protein [Candidatus Binatia bacterium]